MYIANSTFGKNVDATLATLLGGQYFCPSCKEKVVLREGLIKIPHFAHLPGASCEYAGESMLHLEMKQQIHKYLKKRYDIPKSGIALEKPFGLIRPDIYLNWHGKHIGIEVQTSSLTPEQIISRTIAYHRLGLYVAWVLPYDINRYQPISKTTNRRFFGAFRLKEYERIISQMGFKSMLLWDIERDPKKGFITLRLADHFSESREFYDKERGETVSYGPKKLKTMKFADAHKPSVHFHELHCKQLQPFQAGSATYQLPARNLVFYNWPPEEKRVFKRRTWPY
ncbi:MAG: hypothetical protein J0I41_22735 [Filimonas sp.]|nr:hypothetical protein [Filimonas sp.]